MNPSDLVLSRATPHLPHNRQGGTISSHTMRCSQVNDNDDVLRISWKGIECMAKIYFNNAASSWPKAPGIGQVIAQAVEELPSHPGRTGYAVDSDHMQVCREQLAALLGTNDPERIVLCQSATYALNFALLGFPFRRGDVVLTSAQEHNSVLRPLYQLRRERKIRLHIIPVNHEGRVELKDIEEAIHEHSPRLTVLNHASNVTGAVQPIAEVFSLAKTAGSTTLLDASQSLGLVPAHCAVLNADMVAFTGHKYLLGPTGSGGLFVSKTVDLDPVITGGTGVCSDLTGMPANFPDRLEPGTPNVPAFSALAYALRWQDKEPVNQTELDQLVERLVEGLSRAGANVVTVQPPRTPVVSFTLPDWKVGDVGYALQTSFDIICRSGLHCAPLIHNHLGTAPEGTLRLSLSRFNTAEEIDFAIETVARLVSREAG